MKSKINVLLVLLLSVPFILSCQRASQPLSLIAGDWYNGYPLYEVYIRSITPEGTFDSFRENRLDEIKRLGVHNLWLMPIHPIGELGKKGSLGCPYAVQDYFTVNPEYGSERDFTRLVNAAHERGMFVIVDEVLNHSANDNNMMEEHPEWFARDEDGNFTREVADWSDVTDWNYNNHEVHEYLASAMRYWIEEYGIDGYRCDVAGMVPHEFWRGTIPQLEEVNPNLFMLAEWQGAEMIEDGFDSDYDWNLYHRMKEHKEGESTLEDIWSAVMDFETNYPANALTMRFIENHDEQRAATVFGNPGYRPYAALIFSVPGIPLIYSGQEFGATEKPTLFEREPIDMAADTTVWWTYRELVLMRYGMDILRFGDIERVPCTPSETVLAFIREHENSEDMALVVINFSDEEVTVTLEGDRWSPETWNPAFGYKRILEGYIPPMSGPGEIQLEPLGYAVFSPMMYNIE